ncbi:MAG TPA: oligosaccharide flippase family protein [Gaiellales bacterium]|nr:oligosaccharide flippase family protein [Gaiellales bacterium]
MTASEQGAVAVAAASPGRAVRRRLVRGSLTVFVAMTIGTIVTLVLNAILARVMAHSQLGAYFLVFSLVMIASTIGQMGLDRTVVRLVAAARATGDGARARRTVRLVFLLGLGASSLVAVALVLGLGDFIAVHIYHSQAVAGVIGLAALWVLVKALLALTAETFRGFKRFWPATFYNGLAVDSLLVLSFGALWAAGARPTLDEAVGITVAATALALVAGVVMLRRSVTSLSGGGDVEPREVIGISLPLLATSVASFAVGTGVDLWVVGHFRPESDVALYGAAYRLVFFVATGFIIVSQVVPPIIAELHAKGQRRELEQALRSVSTLAGIPAVIVLVTFLLAGPFVMEVVYGPFFRQGATVLAILSIARLVAVCTGSSGATLMMTGHQRTMMTITVATGVVSLTAEILLAPSYGITGVAAATCAAQILQNALQLTFARLRVGIWTHARFSIEPLRELLRG